MTNMDDRLITDLKQTGPREAAMKPTTVKFDEARLKNIRTLIDACGGHVSFGAAVRKLVDLGWEKLHEAPSEASE